MLLYRSLALGSLLVLSTPAAIAGSCEALAGTKVGHAMVTASETVPAGAPAPSSKGNSTDTVKIGYCRVQMTSRPTRDSDIRLELWVPTGEAWNGKFEQVGNGGFAGAIPYASMARVLAGGYAVAGTDDGHQSAEMTDASWALNHPEKIKDYGWRAIRETTTSAKAILRRLTTRAPVKSYFVGCSDGGREALMMAQRFPTEFDGIVAGAPAYAMTRLLSRGALLSSDVGGKVSFFSNAQLTLLQQQALSQCGDGQGYLKDPRQCRVDPSAQRCTGDATEACLSDAQVHAAQVIYADRKGVVGDETLYGVKPGAEAVAGSWNAWLTGNEEGTPGAGIAFTWNYLAFMVMQDPKLDLSRVSTSDVARGQRLYSPIIDSPNADLSAFKAHGGKLIIYHGWNDPGIPPGYSVEYRDRVRSKTADADSFLRLYMVPGMLHCAGGDAPTFVNWQAAIEAWVEKKTPPGELTGHGAKGDTQAILPF